MKAEFTAVIEPAPEGGYWAICPEVPGANGQGETIEEAKASLKAAIELVLENRRAGMLREVPEDAVLDKVIIGWSGATGNGDCVAPDATSSGKQPPIPNGSTY